MPESASVEKTGRSRQFGRGAVGAARLPRDDHGAEACRSAQHQAQYMQELEDEIDGQFDHACLRWLMWWPAAWTTVNVQGSSRIERPAHRRHRRPEAPAA